MNIHRIIQIYQKLLAKTNTAAEQDEFDVLLNDPVALQALREFIDARWERNPGQEQPFPSEIDERIFQHIVSQPQASLKSKTPQARIKSWYIPAAATVLVALATSLYFYRHRSAPNDIAPGYNQAILTLANGQIISLDSAQSGIIIEDEDIKYTNGNSIKLPPFGGGRGRKSEGPGAPGTYNVERTTYNSLSTPKGGQYQIILSDGTKVWLNAASTLKYPSRFSGDKRAVFLEGEAYFEVNNNRSIGAMQANRKSYLVPRKSNTPFIVNSKNQEILVLGTSFNVAAYADEKETKTTLVEGKVQVKSQNLQRKTYHLKLLKPKQQAILNGDSLTVSRADVESETAWRQNLFIFHYIGLKTIMQQLSRWYDVSVEMDSLPNEQFYGEIPRNVPLSQVLRMLEASSSVKFNIKERRIIVGK